MADIAFERVDMGSLFKNNRNLAVPSYQRGYAWTNQEWEDFWNDLNEVLQDNEDDHFLGQVVTNYIDGKEFIVDGQQRVTTSVIFLTVLRDNFKKIHTPKAEIRAEDLQSESIGKNGHYNFEQSEKVADFFKRLIQNEAFDFEEVKSEASTQSEKNFVKAYKYLDSKIANKLKNLKTEEERVEYLEQVQDAFKNHMYVMKISTPDEASAFVIFETLNARGRDLNSSDLLKNHLFRKAAGDTTIQDYWDEMMQPLDYSSEKATKFIRAYWNGTHDFVTDKKLYRALNRKVETRSDAIMLVENLADLSDEFASMTDPLNQISFTDKTLIDNLYILDQLGAKTFYPLVLIMVKKNFSEADIARVLHKIISFTVRNFTIGHLVANKYEKSFAIIARKLNDGKISTVYEINAEISEQMVNDQKFAEDLKVATVPTEKVSKYLLSELAYEAELSKISLPDIKVTYITENVENKDRLGNKLLVSKETAKKFKSRAADKPAAIASSNLRETSKWADKINQITSDEIDERQESWVELAIQIWAK
ncbi:DUF262 domain-containing protein [Weissella viridescens]|uniref:DUF262 domain-containing protein n=1 Tax=Weissella viridescens TaxID=1629 RepID=UPI001C7E1B71|nr:DUF262 domain-containing protein [Weissella viridescens]MBX4173338.1 DUF262 domain-containing protein [Weissella viridescens]